MTAIEAMADEIGVYQREIESLKRQRAGLLASNALLQEQKNEIELRLSLQILKIHEGYLNRIVDLETHVDRIANHVQGLPTRDELEAVEAKLKTVASDYYCHSASCNC